MFGMGSMFLDGGGSVIQSIQYVSVTFGGGDATKDATITAVVVANSVVIHLGDDALDAGNVTLTKCALTSTTNVRFTKNAAGASDAKAVVIEFANGIIKSNQDFEVTIAAAAGSNTATITSVTTGKTAVLKRGMTYDNASQAMGNSLAHTLTLTDATTITGTREGTTGAVVLAGTALEFN